MPPCESRSLPAGTNALNWCPRNPAAAKLAAEHGPDGDDEEEELWIKVADEAAPESPLISNGLRWRCEPLSMAWTGDLVYVDMRRTDDTLNASWLHAADVKRR